MTGFEVYNNAGYKIAGSDFANLVFYGKVTFTATYPASAAPTMEGAVLRFYAVQDGTPLVEQGGRLWVGIDSAVVTCYFFGPVKPAAAHEGLEIYRADGALMFNTARPFLKLAGVIVDPRDSVLGFKYGSSYPALATGVVAPKIAWSVASPRYFYVRQQFSGNYNYPNGFTDLYEYILGAHVSADGVLTTGTISYSHHRYSGWVGTATHVPPTGAVRILVADVSGL